MKEYYIILFVDRYLPHIQETMYVKGSLLTTDILGDSAEYSDEARRFSTREKALQSALALANNWGEDYIFYVCKKKGGRA